MCSIMKRQLFSLKSLIKTRTRPRQINEKMGIQIGGNIDKTNGNELSYNDFVTKYLMKNQPVVLTGLMDNWKACRDWVCDGGQPNLRFFSTHFGKSKVQVADCGTREFTDQKRVEMSVSEFIDHWLEDSVENCTDGAPQEPIEGSLLYLKDWHFVKEYPEYVPYKTPRLFCDDWLNLYLDNHHMHTEGDTYQENNDVVCSDYRFVYMGAKGSWTPLHADVFRSYSWSANVCGQKRWLFLSPSQSHLVFDRNMKRSVYNIFEDANETEFPDFKMATWLECIQEKNEIIFVPSGWYHQVHNLEDTISINHNWFNAYNLSWVWDLLLRDYNEAKSYIEDIREICDDFEGLCQRNLAANTGMNFHDFSIFIARFSFASLVLLLQTTESVDLHWSSSPIVCHLVMNIISTKRIAVKIQSIGEAGNYEFLLDFKDTLNDTKFLQLCTILARTYEMIHKLESVNFNVENVLLDHSGILAFTKDFGPGLCSSADLVKFIDHAVKYIAMISMGDNFLLTDLD